MKCPQCNSEMQPNSPYCAICGLDLEYLRRTDPVQYRKLMEAALPRRQPVFLPDPEPVPVPRPVVRRSNPLILVIVFLCIALLAGVVIGVMVTDRKPEGGNASGGGTNPGTSATRPTEEPTVSATNITRIDYTVDGEDYCLNITYSEDGQPVHGSIIYQGYSYNYFKLSWDEDGRLVNEYFYKLDGNDTVSEHYQYTYDDGGNVIRVDYSVENEKGHNIFVYDESGRQIGIMFYDEAGMLTNTRSYAYSGENRVSKYEANSAGDSWELYEYRYDEADYHYQTVITDSEGGYERVEYTMLDEDTEQVYRYDISGNTLGYQVLEYNQNGRVISQRDYDQEYTEISVQEISYDDYGNITREYSAAGGNAVEELFEYDPLGNLMSMTVDKTNADGTTSHAVYEYTFEAMTVPESLADALGAGMELSELNQNIVNILG